jgi:alkylation response protein AidB-like acyl-CoA dehydrogenase
MQFDLTREQVEARESFKAFVDQHIVPNAGTYDRDEALTPGIIHALARERYLVATLPVETGGAGLNMVSYALLIEEIGRGCGSVRNLVSVQGMVAHAIMKAGNQAQREHWVPRIAAGEVLAAFALSEPEVGSDARNINTSATHTNDGYVLNGAKRWVSFGQTADLFLTFASLNGETAAFLVERGTPGLAAKPISGLLGLRASQLAELSFHDCLVPSVNLLGTGSFAFQMIATPALDYGRFGTACGCVGLGEACLTASLAYTRQRTQFGVPLYRHQLVQQKLTDMITDVDAARLLCRRAAHSRDNRVPDAVRQTLVAKYYASKMAYRVAGDAVQLHGANGCSPDYSVERYLRDAKVQEIIEGTSQIHQIQIAQLTVDADAASRL